MCSLEAWHVRKKCLFHFQSNLRVFGGGDAHVGNKSTEPHWKHLKLRTTKRERERQHDFPGLNHPPGWKTSVAIFLLWQSALDYRPRKRKPWRKRFTADLIWVDSSDNKNTAEGHSFASACLCVCGLVAPPPPPPLWQVWGDDRWPTMWAPTTPDSPSGVWLVYIRRLWTREGTLFAVKDRRKSLSSHEVPGEFSYFLICSRRI